MADLKNAIREMLRRGMTEAQVKENLTEMGVSNVDMVFTQATESLYSMVPQPPVPKPASQDAAPNPPANQGGNEPSAMQPTPTAGANDEKLDDAIALIKALTQINKQILDTNREILLRLKQ